MRHVKWQVGETATFLVGFLVCPMGREMGSGDESHIAPCLIFPSVTLEMGSRDESYIAPCLIFPNVTLEMGSRDESHIAPCNARDGVRNAGEKRPPLTLRSIKL